MRRQLVPVLAAVLLAGSLAAGCSGGGGLREALPSPTKSVEVSPTRSVSPRERDTQQSPAPSRETTTKTETQTVSPAPVSGEGPSIPWLWILLAALVIGVILVLASVARRRGRAKREWEARVADVRARGAALRDAIDAAAMLPPGPGADARWSDIQRSADDLSRTFYLLRDSAPDEDADRRVEDAIAALQSLQSAMATSRPPAEEYVARFDYVLAALLPRDL